MMMNKKITAETELKKEKEKVNLLYLDLAWSWHAITLKNYNLFS